MTQQNIDQALDFAVANNYNVLFRGVHGIGKTAIITQVLGKAKLRWLYFSAATMDPWVDFIGVPKERIEGNISFIEMVRRKELAMDQVDVMIFDELNRAPAKVRNAVMELIQFQSINGKKFNNLRFIWAAINPHDEEGTYDVEKLDPAQIDRFHMHIDLPREPNAVWFKGQFGNLGERAVKWWHTLDDKIKPYISPRRLDYALQIFKQGGDVRYVLDHRVNVSNFISTMGKGDPLEILNDLVKKSPEDIKRYMMDNNNLRHVQDLVFNDPRFQKAVAPHIPSETLLKELTPRTGSKNLSFIKFVSDNTELFEHLSDAILSNAANYSDAINKAFEALAAKRKRVEQAAISKSNELLKVLNSIPNKKWEDQLVTINNCQIRAGDLTPENYSTLTKGRRFKTTTAQQTAITEGKMTLADALKENLQRLVAASTNIADLLQKN